MAPIRVLLFGTPDFAVPTLNVLEQDDEIIVTCVITNLDRPAGRGMDLRPPPLKTVAQKLGIPVFQTDTLKREIIETKLGDALDVEVAVVVACGFFIPKWIRDGLPLGAINLHPSLLPELRGAAPVNWAIIRGYGETGISIFKLVKEMDAGPILFQEEVAIGETETAGQLLDRLSVTGAELMLRTIKSYSAGEITLVEQDEARVTYAPKIGRTDCALDWAKSSREVYNLFRGLAPRPGTHFKSGNENVKVKEMLLINREEVQGRYEPGEVIGVFGNNLRVACGDGFIDMGAVRPPGKGDMSGAEFARGRNIVVGSIIK